MDLLKNIEVKIVNGVNAKLQEINAIKMNNKKMLNLKLYENLELQYIVLKNKKTKEIIGVASISHSPNQLKNQTKELSNIKNKLLNNYSFTESLWVEEKYLNKGYGKLLLSEIYKLWFKNKNKYLLRFIRHSSNLFKSNYYKDNLYLSDFHDNENHRNYSIFLKEKQ